ncbi:MAG: LD-carboxypeptidase [Rubrivivax sp.]|nr:LD-carboxypeptidase [Rubrivivax sp.]
MKGAAPALRLQAGFALPPVLDARGGSVVAVIAPAGPVADASAVLPAVQALYARHGHRARLHPGCGVNTGYLAGDDDLRLADLHAALADPEVAAIHCLRGGYGAMRLLDRIDPALVRQARKPLIGYSDITALHALWLQQGITCIHAPMPASDLILPGRDADEAALFALLHQGLAGGAAVDAGAALATDSIALRYPGRAAGRLIGGNLSLVAALLGTPWAVPVQGAILFLEDVSEQVYRVDRLLTQLRLAGVLDAAAGFVIGSFTEGEAPLALLQQTLLPICQRHGKPLLSGWPAGHGTPNRPLLLGLPVVLDVPG